MSDTKLVTGWILLAGGLALAGCASPKGKSAQDGGGAAAPAADAMAVTEEASETDRFDKPGFYTYPDGERLWVFRHDAKELQKFVDSGDLGKRVVIPRAGPEGRTVKAPDRETVIEYMAQKPGFETRMKEGRLWIFRAGSKNVTTFDAGGEPAKRVTFVKQGPLDTTLMAFDRAVLDDWRVFKRGFTTQMDDGRLWVFHEDSKELDRFKRTGDLGKRVVMPGAGPGGMTIKAPDRETVQAYLAAMDGFYTQIEDGRVWVFRPNTKELEEFRSKGEPAKHVIRPKAGPLGMTIKAPDTETANAYLASVSR